MTLPWAPVPDILISAAASRNSVMGPVPPPHAAAGPCSVSPDGSRHVRPALVLHRVCSIATLCHVPLSGLLTLLVDSILS
ncbi:unnamed protein product [Staurois parvus]|uniref:Uncharacterized protein n=1 Tax=Staurois parvus TaxID=386267 RepID=A0ABN9CS05_9NEOB|nr:unnamed protein product [Staurois parvus]